MERCAIDGKVYFHFLDRVILVGVSNGVGFCVRVKFVTYNVIYLNFLAKMGIMVGFLN